LFAVRYIPPLIKQLNKYIKQHELHSLTVISGHGAVVNALSVLENAPAVYIKLPKKQQGCGALWDFSDTACTANTVNGWVSDIQGSPLTLNQANSYYMNQKGVIYASDKTLAREVIGLIMEGSGL
jgi:3'-phosphoadenosine 5'-phosphosulfate (PAPS) 3'-phosphatase